MKNTAQSAVHLVDTLRDSGIFRIVARRTGTRATRAYCNQPYVHEPSHGNERRHDLNKTPQMLPILFASNTKICYTLFRHTGCSTFGTSWSSRRMSTGSTQQCHCRTSACSRRRRLHLCQFRKLCQRHHPCTHGVSRRSQQHRMHPTGLGGAEHAQTIRRETALQAMRCTRTFIQRKTKR